MRISVCMIVKDEEDQIEEALASIPSTYEKVIVDTGSQDNTTAIAHQFGAKIYNYAWSGHFADARNEAILKATGDYILCMDADERLPVDINRKVMSFIDNFPGSAGAVKIRNITDNGEFISKMFRFFPNSSEYRYEGSVHEKLLKNGEHVDLVECPIELIHLGYRSEHYKKKRKFERYLSMYNDAISLAPQNGYLLYQLGKLFYSEGRFEEAYDAFEKCLKQEEFDQLYFAPMLVQLGYSLKELGRAQEAYNLLEIFLPAYPRFPDIPFLLGVLSIDCGKFDNIERYYKLAIEIGETDHYVSMVGSGSFRAEYNLAVFYEVTAQIDRARFYYQKAADLGFELATIRLKNLRNAK